MTRTLINHQFVEDLYGPPVANVRPILTHPHPMLSQVSAPIAETFFDTDEIYALAAALVETMAHAPAAGLAAVQIGVPLRMLAMAHNPDGGVNQLATVYCNPEITQRLGEWPGEEGCLSFPGVRESMKAPLIVTAKVRLLDGEEATLHLRTFAARVLCHEVDHLDGKTMLDRMTGARRGDFLKRYGRARTMRKAGGG